MQGTPKAIEIKGIVRNATVIGAQDGQAEDLINLRFVDGSWRASGNGRQIENMPTGTIYQQLYVHTNVYHHLLGVDNGTLYWFAEIADDGVTFYPLDNTTDRSGWPEDKQGLPTDRKALTTVVGDIWITQTSHLLTVIDGEDDFEYFIFKTSTKEYKEVNINANGKATDRKLYPYGQVSFNLYEPSDDSNHKHIKRIEHSTSSSITLQMAHAEMINMFAEATKKNQFTKPFVAVVSCRLYDGSHAFTSQPVLLWPRNLSSTGQQVKSDIYINNADGSFSLVNNEIYYSSEDVQIGLLPEVRTIAPRLGDAATDNSGVGQSSDNPVMLDLDDEDSLSDTPAVLIPNETISGNGHLRCFAIPKKSLGVYSNSKYTIQRTGRGRPDVHGDFVTCVYGSDLTITIENAGCIDGDVITGIDVYISNPADIFDMSAEGYKVSPYYNKDKTDEQNNFTAEGYLGSSSKKVYWKSVPVGEEQTSTQEVTVLYYTYIPKAKTPDQIKYSLLTSPLYLLKSYSKNELAQLIDNPIVDLSKAAYDGVLDNILQRNRLEIESTSRTTYLPKVSYMYNNRLHIANYRSYPFFGYPIEHFHLHNHSVKVQDESWFKGVLPKLADNNDEYLQYPCAVKNFSNTAELIEKAAPVFIVKVFIETAQGEQVVTRYIQAYDTSISENGRADFIEDLNPLLTYPDARAYKMEIYYVNQYIIEPLQEYGRVYVKMRSFDLKPHPYLNMAYYFENDLKPIKLSTFTTINSARGENVETLKERVGMQNTEEYFPNGLKVSKTDNPMFFPVENTYQVGSAEILALMSNTIAVGTGQTGAAPLYVFCKDGVYALFVDASGQMTYSNSRVLARDVCNNPRSVAPIDAGVVFTTDRGLMMIAGEQVEEIGQPAEGDVLHYTNVNAQGQPLSVEGSKIATDALTKIAGLPSGLCDTTDFLTYLQDKGTLGKAAIINYNHNMRELIISNPNYAYSYVLDREGNWSRRDYTASQYVNNYPTSYRVDANGHFYKLDDEGDASTSLEHRKEADNQIFYLSNVIKLDSIGFKQAYRFVVRGDFEAQKVFEGTINGTDVYAIGLYIDRSTSDVLHLKYVSQYGMTTWIDVDNSDFVLYGQFKLINKSTGADVTDTLVTTGSMGYTLSKVQHYVGIVVEGSYDGRKFTPLGFNRKSGKFTNIGCHVSHTDVRFYRVILCGQVTGKTRIDYMELSADGSVLNTKIR